MTRPDSSRRIRLILKRAMDVAGSAAALVFLSPVMVGVAFLVRYFLGSPVLYAQVRPGLDGAPFTMFKFRTMTTLKGPDGRLLPDEDRLTPFGTWLRRTSLDELPELWNVLMGDMSLVGPRPLLLAYVDRYTPEQARRMAMRPGITGLAQVRGRNNLSWEERFTLDAQYVDQHSLRLDLAILLQTIWIVVRKENVNPEGLAVMPEFTGSDSRPPSHSEACTRD